MDPRHPQHPFSRNTASPYSHAPFQSTPNQAPFPPSSHSQNATPLYQEHQRRPSENSYYPSQPSYARDGAPMPNTGHSRHLSSSSTGHSTPLNRSMPPPSSPQQQHQQQPAHTQHPHNHSYPPPSLSRGPPPSLSTPLSFPANRDLPSLSSIHRPGSVNSSMSISSMLGGPPPATRELSQPSSQYPAPSSMMASAPPSTSYSHNSPRLGSAAPDYGRFRRPQTPEHQRSHESQVVRDHRANSAGSPSGPPSLSIPDDHRYGTPQSYAPRNTPTQQMSLVDERREQYPVRVTNPNSVVPPRPSSQPTGFNAPQSRPHEESRHLTDRRQEPTYGRSIGYSEREDVQGFRERARLEEEAIIRRERERIDRREPTGFAAQNGPAAHDAASYGRQYGSQQSAPYDRAPEQRDTTPWMRTRHEQPPQEQSPHTQVLPPATAGYDYPRSSAQSYGGPPAYASHDARYPSSSYGQSSTSQQAVTSGPSYSSPTQERQKLAASQQSQQSPYHGVPPPGAYRLQESPRGRSSEDVQQIQQRAYLGLQPEINRKGRNSPFPQAVQGAQGQPSGPGVEPGIKSEFGRINAGLGSGVGNMTPGGGFSGGTQTPFSNSGQPRRDDLDMISLQDSPGENGGHRIARTSSRGGRRRKLKEEDSKGDDDSSTGRRTPSSRGSKRPKGVHHQQMGVVHRHSHNHNHHQDVGDLTSPPSQVNVTTFKTLGAPPVIPSPTSIESKIPVPHHHHINRHHHHHHGPHHKPAPVNNPKPKQIIRSQAVLDSVAHLPRSHLGHFVYQASLKAGGPPSQERHELPRRGFASTPQPLPRFEGRENCTLTVRVPRIYLTPISREEITSRRQVWGTDVYSDDSDIIASCIHCGWFRGEWPKDVDVSALDLLVEARDSEKKITVGNGIPPEKEISNGEKHVNGNVKANNTTLVEPPRTGPQIPPVNCDLLVTILILPALEKYASTTRWGIKSREWSKTHDGLSFTILKIKWADSVETSMETHGRSRRMRMRLNFEEDELEQEQPWGPLFTKGGGVSGKGGKGDVVIRESYIRGGDLGPMEISGLGTSSWWKDRVPMKSKEAAAIKEEQLVIDNTPQSHP